MLKIKSNLILSISIVFNVVLVLIIVVFLLRSQIEQAFNTFQQGSISYPLNDPEIYSFINNDFSYQIKMYKNWDSLDTQDGNVAFKPNSVVRYILNVFNEQSDLNPRQWYTNRFHSQKGNQIDLTVNGFVTYKEEYSENGYDYIDYVIKVEDSIVYFHFTLNDGTHDNSEYRIYFENIVYSVEAL